MPGFPDHTSRKVNTHKYKKTRANAENLTLGKQAPPPPIPHHGQTPATLASQKQSLPPQTHTHTLAHSTITSTTTSPSPTPKKHFAEPPVFCASRTQGGGSSAQLGSLPGPVSLRVPPPPPPPPIREIVAVPPSGLFELAANSSIAWADHQIRYQI